MYPDNVTLVAAALGLGYAFVVPDTSFTEHSVSAIAVPMGTVKVIKAAAVPVVA
jgi:hypothetical protein